jgi:hypothetical protein
MKLAIRCLLFVVLVATCPATDSSPCAIQVFVGEHKSVTVTFPCMARADEIEVISNFFSKGDAAAQKRFEAVLKDAGDITLTLTTARK